MNKNKIKKIVGYIFAFVVLFVISGNVGAKEIELKCDYSFDLSTYNQSATIASSVTEWDYYTCAFYSDNSMDCYAMNSSTGKSNHDNFENKSSVKEWYSKNKTCIPYVTFVDTESITGIEFYGYGNQQEAESLRTERSKFYNNTYVTDVFAYKETGKETVYPGSEKTDKTKAIEEYKNYMKYLEDFGKNSHLTDYCDYDSESGIYQAVTTGTHKYDTTLCRQQKTAVLKQLELWNDQMIDWNKKGYISDSQYNEWLKKFLPSNKSLGTTEPLFGSEKDDAVKQLENKAINKGEIETTKSSSWNSNDGNTNKFLKKIWNMLKIIIPMLVIIFSIVDFLKVLFISDEKNYKEAYTRLMWRIAIGIILFVLPAILSLLLNLAGLQDVGIFEIFS